MKKQDKTIQVAINIDVRGSRNQRCGKGCWAMYEGSELTRDAHDDPTSVRSVMKCDAFHPEPSDGTGTTLVESKKHRGEYMRCWACIEAGADHF